MTAATWFERVAAPGIWMMVQAERFMAWIERKIGVAP